MRYVRTPEDLQLHSPGARVPVCAPDPLPARSTDGEQEEKFLLLLLLLIRYQLAPRTGSRRRKRLALFAKAGLLGQLRGQTAPFLLSNDLRGDAVSPAANSRQNTRRRGLENGHTLTSAPLASLFDSR
ncbi:hypothetical protein SKAU_G00077800 [Synaphobranchus kaupii]|uniref:Uncharacterized protein n=1 Tax=Synaphobranchus kaupii TaxID=118154 RepID=A0A9Q1G877_SYNKA|nr:hypothetical protein SKAU_G00077800 [Synaphobranchus kaupii]